MRSLSTVCPACDKDYTRRVPSHGFAEWLIGTFYLYPFRCQLCGLRFHAFKFGIKYIKKDIDRRQYQRIAISFPARLTAENKTIEAEVVDISIEGCRLATDFKLKQNDLVTLELQIFEKEQPIRVETAIVRSVGTDRIGLEFLRSGDMERRLLRRFVLLQLDKAL